MKHRMIACVHGRIITVTAAFSAIPRISLLTSLHLLVSLSLSWRCNHRTVADGTCRYVCLTGSVVCRVAQSCSYNTPPNNTPPDKTPPITHIPSNSFPSNFFGCENAASRYTGGVKFIADDYAIECEVRQG